MQPEAAAHIWDASEAAKAVRGFTDGKADSREIGADSCHTCGSVKMS
jgi:hypothetical protein